MGFIDNSLSRRAQQRFLRDAMKLPLLSRERETELALAWRDEGDVEAREELVSAHIRLVMSTASRFRHYGIPVTDLVQEGLIGLLDAADRFDPAREVRFSTYAIWWIRAAIQDHVLRNWSLVRTGTTSAQKRLFFGLRRLRLQIEKQSGRPFDDLGREALARQLGTKASVVRHMETVLGGPDRSLDMPRGPAGEDDGQDMLSLLADDRPDPESQAMETFDGSTRSRWLRDALGGLSEREQIIIRARRLSDDATTLADLGDSLGISKERVRQIESRALTKLRDAILERAETPEDLIP